MLLKRWVLNYLQVGEEAAGVARAVVVSTEHFCRHRLAEAAAARHAGEFLPGEKRLVDFCDKSRLIDVLTVASLAE